MRRRTLGRTGLEVSEIALGCAAFSYSQASRGWDPHSDEGRMIVHETIDTSLDLGINYIDTAAAYGDGYSETLVGDVMKTRRGDCVLESQRSRLDARVSTRLEAVIDAVIGDDLDDGEDEVAP